ncbi:MAG: hypothetical protein RQ867_09220 [Mariprofundaceae bacterium]|nr:hypothetical protein [Mariprofundaceae bacterium]
MSFAHIDFLKIFEEDKEFVAYRPSWARMTGSVNSAILLSEVVFWWNQKKAPFYKFKEPFQPGKKADGSPKEPHPLLKEGDSWCESLAFTRSEFDRARSQIAKNAKKGGGLPYDCFVWYWTDVQRLTWYRLNEPFFSKKIQEIYVTQDPALRKVERGFTAVDMQREERALHKNPEGSYQQPPPPTEGGGLPDGLVGLSESDKKTVNGLLAKASVEQQEAFLHAFEAQRDVILDIGAWTKSMARRAVECSLSLPVALSEKKASAETLEWLAEVERGLSEGGHLVVNGASVEVELPFVYLPSGRTANLAELRSTGAKIEVHP